MVVRIAVAWFTRRACADTSTTTTSRLASRKSARRDRPPFIAAPTTPRRCPHSRRPARVDGRRVRLRRADRALPHAGNPTSLLTARWAVPLPRRTNQIAKLRRRRLEDPPRRGPVRPAPIWSFSRTETAFRMCLCDSRACVGHAGFARASSDRDGRSLPEECHPRPCRRGAKHARRRRNAAARATSPKPSRPLSRKPELRAKPFAAA